MEAFIKTLDVDQGVVTAVVKIPLKPLVSWDEQSAEFKALSREQVAALEADNALAEKENEEILKVHLGGFSLIQDRN
jgi:hypothetical protein